MAVTTPASPASPRVATQVGVPATRVRTPRSGVALLAALVAVCAYAVFAHGAVGLPEEPRLQIGLAFVGVGAAIGLLLTRTLSLRAPAEVWIAVGLLAGFAVWCGVTLLWSVAPERTWAHINRAVAYTLVLVLALTLASSLPRAIERFAYGWLAVALACAFYGAGGQDHPRRRGPRRELQPHLAGLAPARAAGVLERARARDGAGDPDRAADDDRRDAPRPDAAVRDRSRCSCSSSASA